MGIALHLKEIGRGRDGARPLSRADAASVFGQILDGSVTDLEVGAFCIAMRVKGETVPESQGFLDAIDARIAAWPAAGERPAIVLPSYNGARRLPVLTPLLALLLARRGWPVLLHGLRTEARRVASQDVLRLLGVVQRTDAVPVAPGEVRVLETAAMLPGLARLLAVREVIGLRNPAHSAVKLLAPPGAVLVTAYTHAEYLETMRESCAVRGTTALLSRGLEGEPAADPRRTPRYDAVFGGAHRVVQEQGPGTLDAVPGLPDAIDAATTAAWTERVLAGQAPVPPGLLRQVELVLALAETAAA